MGRPFALDISLFLTLLRRPFSACLPSNYQLLIRHCPKFAHYRTCSHPPNASSLYIDSHTLDPSPQSLIAHYSCNVSSSKLWAFFPPPKRPLPPAHGTHLFLFELSAFKMSHATNFHLLYSPLPPLDLKSSCKNKGYLSTPLSLLGKLENPMKVSR